MESIEYWRIVHNYTPASPRTGVYAGRTYVKTIRREYDPTARYPKTIEYLERYCKNLYGENSEWDVPKWLIQPITKNVYDNPGPVIVDGMKVMAERRVLAISDKRDKIYTKDVQPIIFEQDDKDVVNDKDENEGAEGLPDKINGLSEEINRLSIELYNLKDEYGQAVVGKILRNKDLKWAVQTALWYKSDAVELLIKASKAKKYLPKDEYDNIVDAVVTLYCENDKVIVFPKDEYVKITIKNADVASRFIKKWGLNVDVSQLSNVIEEVNRISKFIEEVS